MAAVAAPPRIATAPAAPTRRARRLSRRAEAVLVLGGYACLSALLYGRGALPRMGSALVGSGPLRGVPGHDQSGFIWFLDWIARSIVHLRDPLSTMAIYTPHGWNLAWATSVPGPAALLSPVTLLAGPVVSYDLLALLAPVLGAWTAYLLCREIVPADEGPANVLAAIAGGLLFGFSTYETAETINHPNLALVACVPLVALLVIRRHRERMSRTRFVLALGVVLAAQMLISTEILATTVMFAAIAIALWAALARGEETRAIGRTAGEALAGLGMAAVIGAPFLYQAFHFGNPVQGITETGSGLDIANLLTSTHVTLLPGIGAFFWSAQRLHSSITEQTAYLGVPLLVLLGAFAWSFRRTLTARWLLLCMLCVLLLALGSMPIVQGQRFPAVVLPWHLIGQLPLLRFAVPSRFTLYLWLAAAVAVCLWLASGLPSHRPVRWALFALVVISLAPNQAAGLWSTPVDRPSLMHGQTLVRYVPRGSTVLALPYGSQGNSMLWQVEAGFRFRMAGGYASFEPPPEYWRWKHLFRALAGGRVRGDQTPALCSFLRYTGTNTILLRDGTHGGWRKVLGPLGIKPTRAGGFRIYPVKEAMRPGGGCAALR